MQPPSRQSEKLDPTKKYPLQSQIFSKIELKHRFLAIYSQVMAFSLSLVTDAITRRLATSINGLLTI
jgi:hypothetical protein